MGPSIHEETLRTKQDPAGLLPCHFFFLARRQDRAWTNLAHLMQFFHSPIPKMCTGLTRIIEIKKVFAEKKSECVTKTY
jgi:hypothetical protein